MNWFMVVYWVDFGMVMGLNLDESKINFIFAKIPFGVKVKGQRNPSHLRWAEMRAAKPLNYGHWIAMKHIAN